MQGFPYRRLSDPRQQAAPTPAAVGQMLVQRGMTQGASPMAQIAGQQPMGQPMMGQPMGGEGPGPDNTPGHEQAESGAYEAQEGDEMSEQGQGMAGALPALQQRIPAKGMDGDYDPVTEHSPSSTRVALDAAVRQAMGRMSGSERTITPTNTREVLTRLGMPPLEVDLALKTGQFGDSSTGM